jgi:hypothetical protein
LGFALELGLGLEVRVRVRVSLTLTSALCHAAEEDESRAGVRGVAPC